MTTIEAMTAEHLDAAAALLAARQAAHEAVEPLVAGGDLREGLDAAFSADGASGVVAVDGGQVVGYLLGRLADGRGWGTHAWVPRAGHAARDPETVRDLYAAIAPQWLAAGARLHLALVPNMPSLLDPWQRLAFGIMQAEGVRESGGLGGAPGSGVTVRVGGLADLDDVAMPQGTLIWHHQRDTPTFSGLTVPSAEEMRGKWVEALDEDGVVFLVAERDGRPVGYTLVYPADADLGTPPTALALGSAAVVPEERGTGVGLALTEYVLTWAAQQGHPSVVIDWRVANLLSSRFWPARGFRTTYYRLHRVLESG